MRILTIGTGSNGNCYLLEVRGESLILECGNGQYDRLKRALKYDFSKVSGALISHSHQDHAGDVRTLFFATDTVGVPYELPPTDYLMIEANYSRKIIDEKLFSGEIHKSLHDRIIRSHMSFETARLFISQQPNLKGIILIHLSAHNSDKETFERAIQEDTGIPTYIAKPDLNIELC